MATTTRAQANPRAVDSAVQPCPLLHWFSIELRAADAAMPRPGWWPADPGHPYAGQRMRIALGGVAPAQALDGNGRFRADGIPAGSASVDFEGFYAEVEAQLDADRRFGA